MDGYLINHEEEINLSNASDEDLLFFDACRKVAGTNETVTRNGGKFLVNGISVYWMIEGHVICKIEMIKI